MHAINSGQSFVRLSVRWAIDEVMTFDEYSRDSDRYFRAKLAAFIALTLLVKHL